VLTGTSGNDMAGTGSAGCVLFLVGASGSGKTVIAERAAQKTSWSLYDTDAEILARTGRAGISDIFENEGEPTFRRLEAECLGVALAERSRLLVATGGGLPAIPGTMARINAGGASIYLKARVETLWKRLNSDPEQLADRPLLKVGGFAALERLLLDRERTYAEATLTVDTDELSVNEVCAHLVTQMELMETAAAEGASASE
jgi:shikimate kinase